jgi:hypothetical protein
MWFLFFHIDKNCAIFVGVLVNISSISTAFRKAEEVNGITSLIKINNNITPSSISEIFPTNGKFVLLKI